jgi:hypothetical protein
MKKIFVSLFFLSASIYGYAATTWHACGTGVNLDTAGEWTSNTIGACPGIGGTGCTTNLMTWNPGTTPANGDTLDVNGCASVTIDVDPGVASGASSNNCGTVTSTVNLNEAGGNGHFVYATSSNLIIHANFTAGSGYFSTISGSTGGGTFCGNLTGGANSSAQVIQDAHTSVTLYFIGTFQGGSGSSANAYYSTSSGPSSFTGSAYPGACCNNGNYGIYTGSGANTFSGNCYGGSWTIGCYAGSGTLTIAGNLYNGFAGMATGAYTGKILFTPAATNFACYPKDASYAIGTEDCTHTGGGAGLSTHAIEVPLAPSASNVKSGVNYGSLTGTYTPPVSASGSW